jgi:hypothetical protein
VRRPVTIAAALAVALVGFALARGSGDTPSPETRTSDRETDATSATASAPRRPSPVAAPPTAPQPYVVPADAIAVSTSTELAASVAAATPRDIVLDDGVYTWHGPLEVAGGHRLWARNLGRTTLRFGLVLAGATGRGPELHGLRLDISDAGLASEGAAVAIPAGGAENAGVYDSWLLGNGALAAGLKARETNGLRVERVVVRAFTDWGIFFQAPYPDYLTDEPAVTPVITDVDISSVHRPVRGASDGRAEAGLWAGVGCLCSRIRVRDTGWSGVETAGNVNGGVFEDLDIGDVHGTVPDGEGLAGTQTGVGVYLEHYTRRAVFRRIHVHAGGGVRPRVGIHTEWADPAYAGTNVEDAFVGAAFDATIEDSLFDTTHDGIYLADAMRSTIRRNRFVGQKYAAIRDYMTAGSGHATTRADNTFAMESGAQEYTRSHSQTVPEYHP